ncbi:NAD(P)/FAD-dependent oxidoreductase [Persicobacter psychrovividus]|uniref:All-trans-retinol 13,14-reductase n=1 Tax=Persicobacter psychrovividus TaxID=387638 RepID=A0ABM7VM86_9BACT|nr:all-trans-retinol 13,14-reductase [Persicobacter psychrovividus]
MEKEKYDFVIIGSGISGLSCGLILSKKGYKVAVLERHHKIGGCLQNFRRNGVNFDTGIHYVGSMEEGQVMHQCLKYFDVLDKIHLKKMDINSFEKICFRGDENEYPYAVGFDNFIDQLSPYFPEERENISNFIREIQRVCNEFPMHNMEVSQISTEATEQFSTTVDAFIEQYITDPKLKGVLGATNFLYAGEKGVSPKFLHALVIGSYIESAYKFTGGSAQLATAMYQQIKKHGGKVFRNAEVISFETENRQIKSVHLKNGNKIQPKNVISTIHPKKTLDFLADGTVLKAYRNRIKNLPETRSGLVMNIRLKPNKVRYQSHNTYYFKSERVWVNEYQKEEWPGFYYLFTSTESDEQEYASSMTAMTYLDLDEIEQFEDSSIGSRPVEYEAFKEKKKEIFLDLIEEKFPKLRDAIEEIFIATPLTFRDYLNIPDGGLYGIKKEAEGALRSTISPKTKVKNLYLSGQSIGVHGLIGATMSAIVTCGYIIGHENLVEEIRNA